MVIFYEKLDMLVNYNIKNVPDKKKLGLQFFRLVPGLRHVTPLPPIMVQAWFMNVL